MCDSLNVNQKAQSLKYEKKGKKAMVDNLGSDEKEQVRKGDKKEKKDEQTFFRWKEQYFW